MIRLQFKFLPLLSIVLFTFGCSPANNDRFDGLWQIKSYEDNGKDQLYLLRNSGFGSQISFYFPDPDDEFGSWSITEYVGDSSYVIAGGAEYNRPVLEFVQVRAWINYNKQFVNHTTFGPAFSQEVPTYLFEGEWKVVKRSSCKLVFTRKGNNDIKMVLEKIHFRCD